MQGPSRETKTWSDQEHQTWQQLFVNQTPLRSQQLIPEFSRGLELLGIAGDRIPDLREVNQRLFALTGWRGEYVEGFAEPEKFFEMLASRIFPIGSFIRDAKDLSYTPAPDIFHDLYGHIPFYTILDYAKFSEQFGFRAVRYRDRKNIIEQFQRLFWFTIEFGLVQTSKGRRVFGAGIASSFAECAYALSRKPNVKDFDLEQIRRKDFRIDQVQADLFLIRNPQVLYTCLDQFERPFQG